LKRIVSAFAALLLTFAGVVAVESPASAQWNDFNGTTQHIVTGESVSWDWNLCGDSATDNWFTEGALPPGLSLAPSGALTGIATAPGTYYVGNFHCSMYIQGFGQFNNAGSNSGGITISVTQNPSPTPIVNIESQVNAACEFHIWGQVPATPNVGSVKLTLSNGTASGEYQLSDLTAATTFNITASLQDLSTMFNNSTVVSVNQTPALTCGDMITATLAYSTGYNGTATASSNALVSLPEPPTIVSVTNLNDALCDIRVVGTLPAVPDASSVQLTFTDGTDTLVATLTSDKAGQLIDLTIPTKPFSILDLPGVAAASSTNEYQPACGQAVSVTLSFQHAGTTTVSRATSYVTPTQGIVGTPVVSLTVVGGPTCLVAVTAYIPMASDNTSLFVGDFSGNGISGLNLANYPTDRPFTILIPMNAINTTSSPYVSGSSVELSPFTCGTEVGVLVSLATMEATLSDFPSVVHSEITEAQTSTLSCGFGTVKTIAGVCAPAVRGFYVDAVNALTASACPVGYTTGGVGSTSVNDCYKVLAQTVKSLKAPKAMKFKGVIALPVLTTAAVGAQVIASGPCTVRTVAAGGKVAGKKVKVATLAVTAGTVAGNCVLSYTSPEVQHYGTFSQTLTIKVNKKGK
jgi:hypothetical protein